MYDLKFEPSFKEDYRKVKKWWPAVTRELRRALELLEIDGVLPPEYGPHELVNTAVTTTAILIFIFLTVPLMF